MGDFYRSYNEEDLLVAYLTMTENTGGINSELKSAIENRFNFNLFVQKAELRTEKVREKGRISYEIFHMVSKGNDLVHVSRQMTSDILSEEELDQFVTYRFMQYYSTQKHDEVDRKLIGKCILALIVSSVLGTVFLVEMASVIQFFSFILLVPLYMFNHFLVRMITGRNRENPAVFVTVLLSVIIAAVFLIVVSLNTAT